MKHSTAFVDPRHVHPALNTASQVFAALVAADTATRRCPCGATGSHTLCPLQPLTPEIRNAAM